MKTLALALIVSFSSLVVRSQNETPATPGENLGAYDLWAEKADSGSIPLPPSAGFLFDNAPLREGTHVELHGGYPMLNDNTGPVFGRIGITLGGTLKLSYTNEGRLGNVLGMVRPMNTWEMRGQILGQDQPFPLASWIRGNLGWDQENLRANDLWPRVPSFYGNNVMGVRYQYNTAALGLTVQRRLTDALALNVSIGVQRLQIRNFLLYAPDLRAKTATYDSDPRSWLLPDASITAVLRLSPELSIIGEASTLPYLRVDPITLSINQRMGYNAALGARWRLTSNVSLETFFRTRTAITGMRYNEFRIGISIGF